MVAPEGIMAHLRRHAGARGRKLDLLRPQRQPYLARQRLGPRVQGQAAQGAVRMAAIRVATQQQRRAGQARHVRAARLPIDHIGTIALHDASALHHSHQIGHGESLAGIVRDQHRSGAHVAQHAYHVFAHAAAQIQVQRVEGFVQQYQGRIGRKRPGQRHALLLAARQLVGKALVQAGQARELEYFPRAPIAARPIAARPIAARPIAARPAGQSIADIAHHGQMRKQGAFLRHIADAAPFRRNEYIRGRDAPVIEGYPARIDSFEARDQPQQCRLAAARRAQQGEHRALGYGQVYALQHPHVAVAFIHAMDPYAAHGVSPWRSRRRVKM